MSKPAFDMKVRDLAEKIYVDLVSRAASLADGAVKLGAEPAALASTSFKLAAAFHKEQDALNAENLPKNQDFKLDVADLTAWNK